MNHLQSAYLVRLCKQKIHDYTYKRRHIHQFCLFLQMPIYLVFLSFVKSLSLPVPSISCLLKQHGLNLMPPSISQTGSLLEQQSVEDDECFLQPPERAFDEIHTVVKKLLTPYSLAFILVDRQDGVIGYLRRTIAHNIEKSSFFDFSSIYFLFLLN